MTAVLDFHRLDDDQNGHARYSIIRDDKMGPCAYLSVDPGALEIVPLMELAPKLLEALRGLLPDCEAEASRRGFRTEDFDNIKAARSAIAKAGAGA